MNRNSCSFTGLTAIVCLTAASFILCFAAELFIFSTANAKSIDRQAVAERHAITDGANFEIPLGNGEFCFNVDATGLQTFRGNTMAHWGWHSFPLPEGFTAADVPETATFQQGRNQPGRGDNSFPPEKGAIRTWLFDNAHSANLARVRLVRSNGQPIGFGDLKNLKRRYDLWTGIHRSEFELDGQPVLVESVVEMNADALAVRCQSPLFKSGALFLTIDFPYPALNTNPWSGDFNKPDAHTSKIERTNPSGTRAIVVRSEDDLNYTVRAAANVPLETRSDNPHEFRCGNSDADSAENASSNVLILRLEFSLTDSADPRQEPLEYRKSIPGPANAAALKSGLNALSDADFTEIQKSASGAWIQFWQTGAAIDLSESKDPRWFELERKIVLSQYLMRANSAGSWPSAETGLMGVDGWRSQFHGEMIYWHLSHYFLWNRPELADDALKCYQKFIPLAKQLAQQLGYKGAQWPKSTSFNGRTAPWSGNQVLLWKQPHPILFAELEYRIRPTRQTLDKWAEIIDLTAQFMADYPTQDENGMYHLSSVMPPSETGITSDTVFDLAYWRWGLENANRWRERLGQPRNADWDRIRQNLAPLPLKEGLAANESVFVHAPGWQTTYETRTWEHPDIVGVLGMLPPTDGVDPAVAGRSVLKCFQTWQWNRVWGWDFPWTAMGAAKTGQPEIAVDILCHESPRNAYDLRGVNANNPCPYLPGNGGTLYAVALMVAGWDGGPEVDREKGEAPGFPRNGQWVVRQEGFNKAP